VRQARLKASTSLVVALALVVPAAAAKVNVDYRPGTDFSSYRTYAWTDGTPARRDMVQVRIIEAVRRELAEAGLRPVDSHADVYVATHVLVDAHTLQDLEDPDDWEFWTGVGNIDAVDVGAGTLVIDLVDRASGRLVWRGLAATGVSGIPSKKLKKIDKLVGKLFRLYPPRR
jgi:hypothetical protein